MGNLIKMDLYRVTKNKSFWVCFAFVTVLALLVTPFSKLLWLLARTINPGETPPFEKQVSLTEMLSDPFPFLGAMLAMLSACSYFYADVENGYIKNIAGQVPDKGLTVISKFIAIAPHNLLFMAVSVVATLLGSLPFMKIVTDSATLPNLGLFFVRFLLLQSVCSILLFATSAAQNKSLGTVLAVLCGTGLLSLAYMGIDAGLAQLFKNMSFSVSDYMPDQLLRASDPRAVTGILVSVVTTVLFLFLSIRLIDRKDVK